MQTHVSNVTSRVQGGHWAEATHQLLQAAAGEETTPASNSNEKWPRGRAQNCI